MPIQNAEELNLNYYNRLRVDPEGLARLLRERGFRLENLPRQNRLLSKLNPIAAVSRAVTARRNPTQNPPVLAAAQPYARGRATLHGKTVATLRFENEGKVTTGYEALQAILNHDAPIHALQETPTTLQVAPARNRINVVRPKKTSPTTTLNQIYLANQMLQAPGKAHATEPDVSIRPTGMPKTHSFTPIDEPIRPQVANEYVHTPSIGKPWRIAYAPRSLKPGNTAISLARPPEKQPGPAALSRTKPERQARKR